MHGARLHARATARSTRGRASIDEAGFELVHPRSASRQAQQAIAQATRGWNTSRMQSDAAPVQARYVRRPDWQRVPAPGGDHAVRVPRPRSKEIAMPKFVIERDMPGLGRSTPAQLQAASRQSCSVLQAMGPQVQWVHSYVTGDKMYCVYNASDADD